MFFYRFAKASASPAARLAPACAPSHRVLLSRGEGISIRSVPDMSTWEWQTASDDIPHTVLKIYEELGGIPEVQVIAATWAETSSLNFS
jgi:hypothetical protein